MASTEPFSHGSNKPGPSGNNKPDATLSKTRRNASPGDWIGFVELNTFSHSNSTVWKKENISFSTQLISILLKIVVKGHNHDSYSSKHHTNTKIKSWTFTVPQFELKNIKRFSHKELLICAVTVSSFQIQHDSTDFTLQIYKELILLEGIHFSTRIYWLRKKHLPQNTM